MSLLAALALMAAQPAASAEAPHWYAIGTSPLWQVIFANGYLSFETPGRPAVNIQAPAREENAQGYAWRTAELSIIVTRGPCIDALSRRVFSERVTVESGGRRYQGCGGDARGPEWPAPIIAGGGEPFWSLEIANGRLYFGVNEDVFIVPAPRPTVTRGGRIRRYQAPGISVTMRREHCQLEDERTWSDEVTVVAGSWRVLGCGGRVVREAPE